MNHFGHTGHTCNWLNKVVIALTLRSFRLLHSRAMMCQRSVPHVPQIEPGLVLLLVWLAVACCALSPTLPIVSKVTRPTSEMPSAAPVMTTHWAVSATPRGLFAASRYRGGAVLGNLSAAYLNSNGHSTARRPTLQHEDSPTPGKANHHHHQCKHNGDQMLADMYYHGMDRENFKNVFRSSARTADGRGRSFEAEATGVYSNIRIVFRTVDVDNASKVCTTAGQTISDMSGSTATCTADDILTPAKKEILLNQVLPQAVAMLTARLKVDPVVGNLKVGSTSACYLHTIPQSDTTTGVANADYVLYVAAVPSSGSTVAWAGYCELDGTSKRPIVGRSNFSPQVPHKQHCSSAS